MSSPNYITHMNTTEDGYLDYSVFEGKFESYFEPLWFEKLYSPEIFAHFGMKHWYFGPLIGFMYIIMVFGLKSWMKDREPFDLKRELFWWNASLGLFSIFGVIRVLPEFIFVLNREEGFYRSLCVLELRSHQSEFWGLLFLLSKIVEFGDTAFIILRKRPLIVLHWYHHFITFVGCYIMGPYAEPINRYFVLINLTVHSLMYPYFALKALNVSIPKKIANVITSLQFLQMVVTFILILYTVFLYYTGVPCYRHPVPLAFSLATAFSFNLLFGELFYSSVILNKKKKV